MIQLVEVKNRKGKMLRGVLTLPDGVENPWIVLNLHGFGGSKSGHKNSHTHLSRVLLEEGIGCARFDFYGCGESDGEFEELTFTGQLQDTEDLYNWIIDSKITDKEHIILSGQSLGGYVASCAAPKLQPIGLILMCPGGGMWFGCKERSDQLKAKGIQFVDLEGLKFNVDFNYDLYNYEPFSSAKGYDKKVLLVRGTEDKLVNEEACEMYLKCYNKENTTYVQVEGGDHNFASIPARVACEKAIIDFVKTF